MLLATNVNKYKDENMKNIGVFTVNQLNHCK